MARFLPYFTVMKRLLISLAFTLVAGSAFAASITSIAPTLGTVSGGDTVIITVDTPLQQCIICSPPAYFADVTFGGVPARAVYAWDKTITAVTPAHAAGLVDVVVTSHDSINNTEVSYGTAKFLYKGWGSAISIGNYERILVPLALPAGKVIPGAFGSQWTTEFWVRNGTDYPVELFNDVTCTVVCPQFFAADPPYPQIASKTTTKIDPLDAGGGAGILYYVQKTYANDVHFSLHAADISRSKENAGTEIGIVRERDFKGMKFDILNVPVDSGSRASLRLYDPYATGFAYADVEIYSMDSGTLLGTTTVQLPPSVAKPATAQANVVPAFAGYGQISDIRAAFPNVQSGRVRVHVNMNYTPVGWGFVSVTNNSTQLITTFRPE